MKRFSILLLACSILLTTAAGCGQSVTPPDPTGNPVTPNQTAAPAPEQPASAPADNTRNTGENNNDVQEQDPAQDENPYEPPPGNILNIVSTIFPQYDWVCQILGEKAGYMEHTLLLDNRIDLHNYQPSVNDIVKISICDLFIYVGGESDDWAEAALRQATNPDMVVINLMELLGDEAIFDEPLELGQIIDHHHHHHHHHHDDDDDEYDEHVWLSLKNAVVFCTAITEALSALDPEMSGVYEANLSAYINELYALDTEYMTAVSAASNKTLLFADRFPFRYLCHDYGLDFYAAFPGCSAETEASFQTVIFLAGKVNELGLSYILVTESSDQSIAGTIINNSSAGNQKILVLDSMQSSNAGDRQQGITYLSIMKNNLQILKEALI